MDTGEDFCPPRTPWIEDPRIELGEPRHGWLPITVKLGEYELSERASHVLNDPVEELIDWGAFVRDGVSGFRRVCLWLEPAAYALDVRPANEGSVYVNVWFHQATSPPMMGNGLEPVFQAIVSRQSLYNQVLLALTRWLDRYRTEIQPHWEAIRCRILPAADAAHSTHRRGRLMIDTARAICSPSSPQSRRSACTRTYRDRSLCDC
jgi:hypothetical protein